MKAHGIKPKGKPHLEFFSLEGAEGWHTPPGYPEGFEQLILTSDLDEDNMVGSRSRIMRLAPGTYTKEAFEHDHWEEVFLFDGDLTVGNDAQGNGGEQFVAPTYACRPPGAVHGPFKSTNGCMMFELHYYTGTETGTQ